MKCELNSKKVSYFKINLLQRYSGNSLRRFSKKKTRSKKKSAVNLFVEKGEIWCDFCNVGFQTSEELNEHNDECHVECDLCKQVFKRRFHLKNHMKLNHSDIAGKVDCEYCSKTFSTHMSRWVHVKTVHKNNWKYKCNDCEYGTTHLNLFQNHVKKHSEPLNLRCSQCDKEFISQYRYDIHVRIHEKDLTCSICNKNFDKRKNMLRHMSRNHKRKKTRDVPCTACDKRFFDKWALKVHMEVHNNRKEKCTFCDYATCHPKNLRAHVKNHVQEYDFVCELCGRGFVYNFMLRDHMTKEHGDGLPRIPCEICGKTFASQQYLNVHKLSHEPGYEMRNHQCEICGKRFLTRSMLLRHVRNHNRVVHYVCRYCNKFLSCLATLKDHEKIHTGEKPFICEVCGKSFAAKKYLVTHSRTHTNEKPYSCQECGAAFTQRGTLSVHKKSHAKKDTVKKDEDFTTIRVNLVSESSQTMVLEISVGRDKSRIGNDVSENSLALNKDLRKNKERSKAKKSEETRNIKELVEKSSKGKNFCIMCNVQYFEKNEFEVHAKSHKRVNCMICNKLCLTGLRLLSHIRNVHSDRPRNISCDQCSKMFATTNSLWVHKRTLHKKKWQLTCSECGYGTNSKEIFEEHLQKAGENHSTFKCDACDKEYASQQNLDKHVQLYHADHRCKFCNKEYGSRNNLLRHIQRSHGKQKSRDIPCDQCSKLFYTKWQLKVHMNLHLNKKYQCTYCEYSSVYPQALKTHVKIHTKQYSCICDWCGKGFMNKCALKNHMAREHLGVVISCSVCQKKFHAQKYLDLHMECHQPGYEMRNHQCEICGRKFLRRPMLRRHIRAHKGLTRTYKCSYCGKVLTSSSSLKDHTNIHTGQKPYVCEMCGNGFARKNYLTAHLRTHTKEKPFGCEECGSSFSQRGTLTMHLRKHRGQMS